MTKCRDNIISLVEIKLKLRKLVHSKLSSNLLSNNIETGYTTQISSVLAVATVFISLWTRISLAKKGDLYVRQKYLCRNLSQKCKVAYTRGEGGVIAGFYGNAQIIT